MQLPEYVTKDEVKRICPELKISDWSRLTEPKVSATEAQVILNLVKPADMDIPLDDFRVGLEVELEHGTQVVREKPPTTPQVLRKKTLTLNSPFGIFNPPKSEFLSINWGLEGEGMSFCRRKEVNLSTGLARFKGLIPQITPDRCQNPIQLQRAIMSAKGRQSIDLGCSIESP